MSKSIRKIYCFFIFPLAFLLSSDCVPKFYCIYSSTVVEVNFVGYLWYVVFFYFKQIDRYALKTNNLDQKGFKN